MKNKQIKKRMKSKHFNGLMEVFKKKIDYKYQKTDNDRDESAAIIFLKMKESNKSRKGLSKLELPFLNNSSGLMT